MSSKRSCGVGKKEKNSKDDGESGDKLYEEATPRSRLDTVFRVFRRVGVHLGSVLLSMHLQLWLMRLRTELEKVCFIELSVQTI